ncbi:hypothetical protein ACWGI8_07795 [Streptomyces sp. NPDC054841]
MRIARSRKTRSLAVAVAAAGLLVGGITAGTSGAATSERPTDTIVNTAAQQSKKQSKTRGRNAERCLTDTAHYEVRNHWVNIKTADLKIRITRCVNASGALTSGTTSRIFATTTTAGDLLYGVTVTPETTPAVIKATGSRYILQQDVEHKTCLGTKYGPWCYHNNITFTITVNKTGTKWEVSSKDTSGDDDIVPA